MSHEHLAVGLVIRHDGLRELVETYLELSGFHVVSSRPTNDVAESETPDIVVTESAGAKGRLLTVRLTEALVMPNGDPAIVMGLDDLTRLPEVLRSELHRRVHAS